MIATALSYAVTRGVFPEVEFEIDDDGYVTSANPIMPPIGEVILGFIASGLVFFALFKFAGPPIKKFYADRTARIQRELDDAAAARAAAEVEATQIRTSLGDIDAERERLFAEAATPTVASRSGDELRSEISRFAAEAIDRIVIETLDDATQQQLIEDYISKVGASGTVQMSTNGGATS